MMNFNKTYLIVLATLVLALLSCTHDEPDLFEASDNGVYFNYDDEADFTSNLNFATHIVNPIDFIDIELNVKLLGHLADHERQVHLVGEAVEGYEKADIDDLPKTIVFAAGEYEKTIKIRVRRPANEDNTYATALRLQPISGDIGEGLEGKDVYNVYTSCIYSEPENWKENEVYNFYGEWTKDKHIFLARGIYGDDNYAEYTFEQLLNGNKYNYALDSLRRVRDIVNFDILYYYCDADPLITTRLFAKPDYWTEQHDQYLDNFTSRPYSAGLTFLQIAETEGLTTKTDKAYFEGDEEHIKQLNKRAVEIMQDVYDELYMIENFSTANYATRYYVPFINGLDYNLREPYCWSDNAPEGKAVLETYYGTYSREKFAFMINTLLDADSPHATLYRMFPISRTWDDKTESYKVNYDRHYKNESMTSYFTGHEILLSLNQLFREADTENKYDFPIITE